MEAKKEQVVEKGLTEYQVAGQTVKLSFNIVKNFLVKGNGEVNNHYSSTDIHTTRVKENIIKMLNLNQIKNL